MCVQFKITIKRSSYIIVTTPHTMKHYIVSVIGDAKLKNELVFSNRFHIFVYG